LLGGYLERYFGGLWSLPDDPPQEPAQAKLGPPGQVIRSSGAAIAAAEAGRGAAGQWRRLSQNMVQRQRWAQQQEWSQ